MGESFVCWRDFTVLAATETFSMVLFSSMSPPPLPPPLHLFPGVCTNARTSYTRMWTQRRRDLGIWPYYPSLAPVFWSPPFRKEVSKIWMWTLFIYFSFSVPCHCVAVTLTFIVNFFRKWQITWIFKDILGLGYQWSTSGSGTLLLSPESFG